MHHSFRLAPALALVLLTSGISAAQVLTDLGLTGTFEARYDESDKYWLKVAIMANFFWGPPPEPVLYYELKVDNGGRLGTWGEDHQSGSGQAAWKWFSRLAEPDARAAANAWVAAYLNREHTLHLVLWPWNQKHPTLYDDFQYLPPDVLTVAYWAAALPYGDSRPLQVSHDQNGREGFDIRDVEVNSTHPNNSGLVSVLIDPDAGSRRNLKTDTRPKDSPSDLLLELRLISASGEPVIFSAPTRHELRFGLPNQPWGNDFPRQPVTIQQYDPLHPAILFPIYDVKKLVARNAGVFPLPDLQGSYDSGQPFAYFRLSFTRPGGADLTDDGRLDLRDFSFLARDWHHSGPGITLDLGGPAGWGAPDGRVDARDLQAFCWDWAGYRESFESGRFAELKWIQSWPAWTVTTATSHSGHASAQAAAIGHDNTCSVMVTLDCTAGSISFWRKVSSERDSDFLRFRIWPSVIAEWSGELDWQKVCIPVPAGRHTFAWEYVKDNSGSGGADTAWIDDITFPREQRPTE